MALFYGNRNGTMGTKGRKRSVSRFPSHPLVVDSLHLKHSRVQVTHDGKDNSKGLCEFNYKFYYRPPCTYSIGCRSH